MTKPLLGSLWIPALLLLGPGSAASAGGPDEWLKTDGKSAEWTRATAAARNLLKKLNVNDAKVRAVLPRLRERCEILRRADGFDWRSATAIDLLEGMLEDLSKGAVPMKRYAGQGLGFGYWSATLRRIEAIWVQVPPHYDPARDHQIFMYYKCGGGIHCGENGKAAGGYRPTAELCRKFDDTFHAWSSLDTQVKGRMGAHVELEEAMAELQKDFSINPDRVFLSGWSDGGFTSFWLASHYPHQVAGIAPNCANWQYGNVEEIGLFNVPVLVVDGWHDGGYNNINVTRFHALANQGYDISGIFAHHDHSYQPYEDEGEFRKIIEWARPKRRNLYPKRVKYATWNLAWHQAYWFSIERVEVPALAAQIDAEVKPGNRVEVQTRNVAAYTLLLSDKLMDPVRPVTVVTDGKPSYQGPFMAELGITLSPKPSGKFVQSAERPGEIGIPLEAATYDTKGFLKVPGRPWMWVRPTGGAPEERALLDAWVPSWAKNDADVTDRDMETHDLFLFGGPEINRLTSKMAAEFPVKFEPGKFTVGTRVYDKPRHGIKFLHPNPLNPRKYVIVYAFNDMTKAREREFLGLGVESVWEFRVGDAVVVGLDDPAMKFGVSFGGEGRDYYIWDAQWRAAMAPVGTAEKRFGYGALLRLKADAMRKAAQVDAAFVYQIPVPWNRWKTSLPQGPVTLNDLAVTHMWPEYALLGEVTGARLLAMAREAAASTLLARKDDPSYDPASSLVLSDIDPRKTYRIALENAGAWDLAFEVDPSKIPPLVTFRNAKEFSALPAASFPVANLRHSSLEWTEAVVSYLRKRRAVAPRAACFDLTEYVADPAGNEFGACDWLHLNLIGAEATLNLGLRESGAPEAAPPRPNSKAFAELDMNRSEQRRFEEISRLEKKLPAQVVASMKQLAVMYEGGAFTVSESADAAGRVGRALLLRLRLANLGSRPLAGVAALGLKEVQEVYGRAWPDTTEGKTGTSYAAGYRQIQGDFEKPSGMEAKLFIHPQPVAGVEALILRNAGYNSGLIGFKRDVTVPAAGTVTLPVLFLTLEKSGHSDAPVPDLNAVLEAIRPALMKLIEKD